MRSYLKPTHMVLLLLCLMYFITYMDRVNIGTAASAIQKEMGFSNTTLGFVFSAFAYPYLAFQIFGGWVGDQFGPRRTLFACGAVWALATILTGFAGGFVSLFLARVLLGFGEGATFPTATRAMQYWTAPGRRGFAQGLTHSFARLGNFATPIVVAALMASSGWRGAFVLLGCVSLVWVAVWFWYFRDDPREHPGITQDELAMLPSRKAEGPQAPIPFEALLWRMWPVTLTYFCYGWCLWLYLNWLPLFFRNNYSLDIGKSAVFASGVFLAGVVGDTLGGVLSDLVLRRTGKLRLARLSIIFIGFVGAFLSLLPMLYIHDLTSVAISLSGGFFFAELCIGPMWSIPMDIAPKFSGTASGLMNSGSALAAIVSPLVAGFVIDLTGNWILPFVMSMALLALGAACAFAMHPEIPFDEERAEGRPERVSAAVK
jgi:MFS family permease